MEQDLLSVALSFAENVTSMAILAYFAMYFRQQSERMAERYIKHLESHDNTMQDSGKGQ